MTIMTKMTKTVLYNCNAVTCNAVTRNAADDRNCELCKYFSQSLGYF